MADDRSSSRQYLPLNCQWNGKKDDWHAFTVVLARKVHMKDWTDKSPWDSRTFHQEYLKRTPSARPPREYRMDPNDNSKYLYDADGESILTEAYRVTMA